MGKSDPGFQQRTLPAFWRTAPGIRRDGGCDHAGAQFPADAFMEYLEYTGTYSDVPVQTILREWKKTYGEARVNGWIHTLENSPEGSRPDFASEEIV